MKVSKKYGLNPSVTHCEYCGKEIGIALFGASWKDKEGNVAEAPYKVAMGLCDSCKSVVDQKGTLVIEVKDGESGNNPYRTGRIVGISHDAAMRLLNNEYSPMAYMEHSMFDKIFSEVLNEEKEQ